MCLSVRLLLRPSSVANLFPCDVVCEIKGWLPMKHRDRPDRLGGDVWLRASADWTSCFLLFHDFSMVKWPRRDSNSPKSLILMLADPGPFVIGSPCSVPRPASSIWLRCRRGILASQHKCTLGMLDSLSRRNEESRKMADGVLRPLRKQDHVPHQSLSIFHQLFSRVERQVRLTLSAALQQ
jgi:hypothetical protein